MGRKPTIQAAQRTRERLRCPPWRLLGQTLSPNSTTFYNSITLHDILRQGHQSVLLCVSGRENLVDSAQAKVLAIQDTVMVTLEMGSHTARTLGQGSSESLCAGEDKGFGVFEAGQ